MLTWLLRRKLQHNKSLLPTVYVAGASGGGRVQTLGVKKQMAKVYFEKLSALFEELRIENEITKPTEIKHFFNGAALYVNKTICASWSPAGLAFKVGKQEANKLIKEGKATPLKYFTKGQIKKGYVLFKEPNKKKINHWKKYFIKSAQQV